MTNNNEGITIMKGNVLLFGHMEKSLDECLNVHTKACYNWVGGNWLEQFEEDNRYATTLNVLKYILSIIDSENYTKGEHIRDEDIVENNEKGLEHLINNVTLFNKNKITLKEMIDNHIKICAIKLNEYKENFTDGWSRDLYLNILKYVIRAEKGDEKAMDRLKVDLGIEECTLTIVEATNELCEVRNNFDICNNCGFCGKGDI